MEPVDKNIAPKPGTPEHAEWLKKYNEELLRQNPQWKGKLPTAIRKPRRTKKEQDQ